MRRNISLWSALALTAAVFLFSACEQVTSSDTEPEAIVDSPAEGVMKAATADKIFGEDGWGTVAGKTGVEIIGFKDAAALEKYLGEGSQRQTTGTAVKTLKLGTIEGKPIIRIREKAFAPKPEGGGDITRIVSVVELPNTVEELGKSLFDGVKNPVKVDIPQTAPVLVKIVEEKVAAARAEAEAALGPDATEEEIQAKLDEAEEAAVTEAVNEIAAVLQAAAGKEAGVVIIEAPPPAPGDPSQPVPPALPPIGEIKETPVEIPPAPPVDPPVNPDPGTPSPTPAPPVVTTYKVTYNGNGYTGGTVRDNNRYTSGAPVTILGNDDGFVKTGYEFTGWNTKADGSGDPVSGTYVITGNITFYAQWVKVWYVTYKANGGIQDDISEKYYTEDFFVTIREESPFTRAGYVFNGWKTRADGTGAPVSGSLDTPQDITLFAQWLRTIGPDAINGIIVGPGANAAIKPPVGQITGNEFTGTVTWTPALAANGTFTAGALYNATIILTAKPGWTLTGVEANSFTVDDEKAIVTNEANSGVISVVFPSIRLDNPTALAAAITAAKDYNTDDDPEDQATIYLSSGFYGAANTAGNVIVIDPADAVHDNDTPYTIKGLGKDSTEKLTVGILLANDNVTLDGVRIEINERTRSAITSNDGYNAAVSIGRYNSTALLTGENQASKDVTVQNCNITFNNGNTVPAMTVGIFVCATGTTSSTNIAIINNHVTVTNQTSAATQAIVFRRIGSNFILTDNVLSSSNASTGTTDSPASGIILNILQADFVENLPIIEDNELRGKEFDFYINLFSLGNRKGNEDLFEGKFGTEDSTWATSEAGDDDLYRELLNMLLEQAKGPAPSGTGARTFGRFAQYLGGTEGSYGVEFALEYYEIDNGKITAVNFWSAGIEEDAITYTSGADKIPTNEALNLGESLYNVGIRGRFTVDPDGTSNGPTESDIFHWTRNNATGPNLPLPPPEEPAA
jgi:uncharacterized repeat protein (TIGR02543 family)